MDQNHSSQAELLAELAALRSQVTTLQRSNESLSGILQGTRDLIAAVDFEYRLIAFNAAYQAEVEANIGKKPELGMSLIDLLAHLPEQQAIALERWGRALRGEEFTVVQELVTVGKPIYYEISYSPIRDQENHQIGASQRVRNVSHRKQAEDALKKTRDELEMRVAERTAQLVSVNRQLQAELDDRTRIEEELRISQERFAGILEIASDAIISIDAQQRITLFNQGAERIFGYNCQEVLGQPLDILLPNRFANAHQHHVAHFGESTSHARKMGGERREIYGRRKDGSEFPSEASISKLQLGSERVYTVILQDITERKQAEQALERLSRQNELILDSMGEGLCGIDLQGNITFTNPAAARLLGYQVEHLKGQSIRLILPHLKPDGQPYPFEESPIYAALQNGSVYQVTDEMFYRHDGTHFPVEYISTPIRERDEIIGAVVTFRDVTDRRVIEKMKDEFISVVSHELRTPLTSIHGSLGMLASGLLSADSEKGKRLLQIAVDSTDRLVRLINDVLDIERIESGKVTMAKDACDIADLIDEAINVTQPLADKGQVKLEVASVSAQLWADPDRVIQILTNLLSNAIKFSPPGEMVQLSAELVSSTPEGVSDDSPAMQVLAAVEAQMSAVGMTPQERSPDTLLIQIKDHGRGIPGDKLDTIFERFQQVDASDSRNHEGTGLGLAICRSIVQQHAGRIWVESTLGEGSTFYFTLPLLKEEPIAPTEVDPHAPLVLVCDDDDSVCRVLQTLLERYGYRVMTVLSGQEAIVQAAAAHPNVILLDLLMPGMNGWEVMATLKEREDTQNIPIVICSVSSPSQSNYPAKGFINWVGKPVDEVSLLQSLRQALARSSQQMRVLVVEDDPDLAELLISLFKRHDLEIFHAPTGREAIRLSQQIKPDLLVLDLVLPDGDGFRVVDWLRQHSQLYCTPLVIYSARDLGQPERDRLKLGQTEFLTKGQVTIQEFEHRVMEILHGIVQSKNLS